MANVVHAEWVISYMRTGRSRTGLSPMKRYGGDMNIKTPGNDPIYKRLYSFAEMVEDLLHSVFPDRLLDAVDWPSLSRLPTAYVSGDFRQRHGDTVWRARLRPADGREEWLYPIVAA